MNHTIKCPHCGSTAAVVTIDQAPSREADTFPAWGVEFFRDCCALSPGTRTRVSDVRSAYLSWTTRKGVPAVSAKRFGMDVNRHLPVTSIKGSKGVRYFVGLRLL